MHVFLTYPKSGRTWLRFMIDSYLCRVYELTCDNVFEAEGLLKTIKPMEWTHLTAAMIAGRPYWSMGPMNLGEAVGLPWLMLTRNFEATLRSAFFQARDRMKLFAGSPSEFVRDARFGIVKLVTFYNFWEIEIRPQLQQVRMLAFETMQNDPRGVLVEVLESLGLAIDENLVTAVVAQASFENMKALSVRPEYVGTPLAPMDPNRPESFKVRSNQADESLFTEADRAYMQWVASSLFCAADRPEYRFCLGPPPPPQGVASAAASG